jgi:hypothetical protein
MRIVISAVQGVLGEGSGESDTQRLSAPDTFMQALPRRQAHTGQAGEALRVFQLQLRFARGRAGRPRRGTCPPLARRRPRYVVARVACALVGSGGPSLGLGGCGQRCGRQQGVRHLRRGVIRVTLTDCVRRRQRTLRTLARAWRRARANCRLSSLRSTFSSSRAKLSASGSRVNAEGPGRGPEARAGAGPGAAIYCASGALSRDFTDRPEPCASPGPPTPRWPGGRTAGGSAASGRPARTGSARACPCPLAADAGCAPGSGSRTAEGAWADSGVAGEVQSCTQHM